MDFAKIIKTKYPAAELLPDGNVEVERRPILVDGKPSSNEWETVITRWELDAPQPAIEELEAWGDGPEYEAAMLAEAKAKALVVVRQRAAEAEAEIDNLLGGHFLRAVMLNTEIVQYINAGRPASPSHTVYALADALAQRRGVSLREMLEALRSRWLTLRGRIATIITELDRVEDELSAAGSVGEITEILGRLDAVIRQPSA